MIRSILSLLAILCWTSGCVKGNSDDVDALRKEVGKLRQEVDALKSRAYDPRRVERRTFAKDAGRAPVVEESAASDGARQTRERIQRPTPEELRARHEAMRDPGKRAELRAEHKARMEERRRRMEEHRQQRRSGGAESQTDISNQQKQN